MLDSIQDVRNVGAILRSAYCTGVDGVVMCKSKSAPVNAKDVQALGQAITLPQKTPDISYNASVASGILLFLASTQTKTL